MKDNKTIGFDILDNAGLDKIDQIGTDTDMLDEKTKKRILEMTRKRFNDAIKGEDKMTFNNDINESAEIVENVEVYKRSKISKIMTRVINTAAVAGIAAGSVFLVKNINRDNKPVEPDLPAVSSTEDGELTAEEKARNQRIEEYIQELYYAEYSPLDENEYYEALKIEYAYLDLNNDSTDELFIYHFNSLMPDYESTEISCFDGTKYVPVTDLYGAINEYKFDLKNCKLYSFMETEDNKSMLITSTWADSELKNNSSDYFKIQDKYSYETVSSEFVYKHNDSECTKEEYDKAMAEYENCVGAELKFSPYDVKKAAKQPTANLSNEAAANQRIEEYIQEIYNQFGMSDEDRLYDCLKIDYAYLDINNDSVDELFIRYDFLEAAADAKGIGLNYFDGTKYVHSYNVSEIFKIDLNNRKLYDLAESHEGERWLDINTWENVKFSADSDFFTLQDNYFEIIDSFAENTYTHNNEPCTKEEYDKAIAEYENCVSAELKFSPYDVKKAAKQPTANLSNEAAANQRIEDFIRHIYVSHNEVLDKETFDDTLKIEYAYLDINNDSTDELLIRYDFLKSLDYSGVELNYFDGTEYKPFDDIQYASKFDLQNRKLYELHDGYEYEGFENEFFMEVKTWENAEIFCDVDFFTYQENYHYYMNEGELFYIHNGEQCTEEELKTAKAKYENCDNAGIEYISYIPDDSFFLENSVNNTANGQSAEETARNKRIEEYIDYLCYYCDGESDKDKFYDTIKIDYAYLDINNDSVDELLIRYHNLNDFSPYYEGTEINYFDGTKYIPVGETNTTFKFDLQNRKLYQLSESQEGGYWLFVRTWNEFSDDSDFFTFKEEYTSDIISFDPLEYTYSHNDTECSMEEYEKAMAEYENCVGAELKFNPYTIENSAVKKVINEGHL